MAQNKKDINKSKGDNNQTHKQVNTEKAEELKNNTVNDQSASSNSNIKDKNDCQSTETIDDIDPGLNLLKTQNDELMRENNKLKDDYIRIMAEFDNYRKRTSKEKLDISIDAVIKCVLELLPAVDTFEKALEYECEDQKFKHGIEMILTQLKNSFSKIGIEEIDSLNQQFNPDLHNAISQIQDENFGQNIISQVCQKGYKIGDKVVRHSIVIVANP